MGILKRIVLPAFGIVHAASFYACKDLKTWGLLIGLDFNDDNDNDDKVTDADVADKKFIRQAHMLGCLRGFNLAMLGLCGYGIFAKSATSDYRQAIAMAEHVLFSVATLDAIKVGPLNYYIPAAHSLLALTGFIVSYLEPGIFTKDHNQ
jgi:hypothetical protein